MKYHNKLVKKKVLFEQISGKDDENLTVFPSNRCIGFLDGPRELQQSPASVHQQPIVCPLSSQSAMDCHRRSPGKRTSAAEKTERGPRRRPASHRPKSFHSRANGTTTSGRRNIEAVKQSSMVRGSGFGFADLRPVSENALSEPFVDLVCRQRLTYDN